MTSIRDTLATEGAEAETRHDEAPGRMHRTRSTAGTTSQVYTLRMPTERLDELRAVAEQSGSNPPPSCAAGSWNVSMPSARISPTSPTCNAHSPTPYTPSTTSPTNAAPDHSRSDNLEVLTRQAIRRGVSHRRSPNWRGGRKSITWRCTPCSRIRRR